MIIETLEIWKDIEIEEFKWLYQVSNLWIVKSLWNNFNRKEKILKPYFMNWYICVPFTNNWYRKNLKIHRLVASAFHWLDLKNPKQLACHKNDIRDDNREYNIFVWSLKDNTQDMIIKKRDNLFWKPSKIILQFTKYWDFIKEWNSMSEIFRELWILQSSINRCCNWVTKIAKWFVWKYK